MYHTVEINLSFTHAMGEHSLSMDGEQLFACEISDNVNLKRFDRLVPLKELQAILGSMAIPWWSQGGCCHLGDGVRL
jgi:hypothetical protein